MRVLVTGAYGFIGAHVVKALRDRGADVIGAGRNLDAGQRLLPEIVWRHADFNELLTVAAWRPVLESVDAIVNCVGILQSTRTDDAHRIQVTATTALFAAAEAMSIRRLVHVSAMSAEPEVATEYAASRVAAEQDLARRDLEWVIVKPSLVLGEGSFGGTSMLRGLAGLPLVMLVPDVGGGRFQPIAMRDLADGLATLALTSAPSRQTLYAAGPEAKTVADLARDYRRWLGFPARPVLTMPGWLTRIAARLGDGAARLGSPSALRTASVEQMRYGEVFDPAPFAAVTGRPLATVAAQLAATPARIQDRLHARLYAVRPVMQLSLALFWIASGVIALLPGPHAMATNVLTGAGFDASTAGVLVTGGAIADLLAGVLMLNARWTRLAGVMQLALIASYLGLGTWLTPHLWLDPLGPIVKVIPIAAATLAVMAMAEER